MHVSQGNPVEDACLTWLWRELFSADGLHARCQKCTRERGFHRVRGRRAYACDSCGHQVYPTAGTPFAGSRTPLQTWAQATRWLAAGELATGSAMAERLAVSPATAARMRRKLLEGLDGFDGQAALLRRFAVALGSTDALDPAPGEIDRRASTTSRVDGRRASIDRIRAAACRAFARNGVDATRLADIAREAGVSAGSIYYYFRHKDDLLLAALTWAGEEIDRRLAERAGPGAHPLQRLAAMLEACVPEEGLLRDELLLWLEVWLRARHHGMLLSETYKLSAAWYQRMTRAIEDATTDGSAHPVAPAAEVTQRLVALANDLGFKASVGHGPVRTSDVRRRLFAFAAEQLDVDAAQLTTTDAS